MMAIDWDRASNAKTPTDSAGFLLWQVYHLWHRRITRALKPLKLTHMQFVLLACAGWLTREIPLLNQKQLSEFTGIDVMTVSQVLRTLEKKGFIRRRPHPQDPRSHAISLHASGTRILEQALPIVEASDAMVLASGSQNVAELLRCILEKNSEYNHLQK